MNCRAVISATGHYTPESILSNADLERIVDTSDEWIVTRTGIRERHIRRNGESTSDFIMHAAHTAMAEAHKKPENIEAVIVGTVTPDFRLPSTASVVQKKLGLPKAAIMDVAAACAGFIYGLAMAKALVESGMHETVLVAGAEALSSITNYQDRNTCVLFGDGCGCAIVTRGENGNDSKGILSAHISGDGRLGDLLHIPIGGSHVPLTPQNYSERGHYIIMDGREVFKHAVREMVDSCERALRSAGLTVDDIDVIVPHQANIRIIEALTKRLNADRDKVYVNIDRYGNTSAASVPIALDEARRLGVITEGKTVLMTAFGGGLTWGSAVVRF
jgi:3-oxoacyl-[acyl-carrier-protein] synthase-3